MHKFVGVLDNPRNLQKTLEIVEYYRNEKCHLFAEKAEEILGGKANETEATAVRHGKTR